MPEVPVGSVEQRVQISDRLSANVVSLLPLHRTGTLAAETASPVSCSSQDVDRLDKLRLMTSAECCHRDADRISCMCADIETLAYSEIALFRDPVKIGLNT